MSKRSRITTVQALNMLIEVERAIARVEGKAAVEEWQAARATLRSVRNRLDEHVRAALSAGRVR